MQNLDHNAKVVDSGGGSPQARDEWQMLFGVREQEPEDIDMVSCAICGHSFPKDDCIKNTEGYWVCETCNKEAGE